jgi:hypothetical protein
MGTGLGEGCWSEARVSQEGTGSSAWWRAGISQEQRGEKLGTETRKGVFMVEQGCSLW